MRASAVGQVMVWSASSFAALWHNFGEQIDEPIIRSIDAAGND